MYLPTPIFAVPGAPYLVTPASPQVDAMFPHAVLLPHPIQFGGARLAAIPHGPDEHNKLLAAGAAIPNPLSHSYPWPSPMGKAPFQSQKDTAGFLVVNRRAFVLSDMGVGKTRAALFALDWLRQRGHVRRALILAPLSTLSRVWESEIFLNFPHMRTTILHGSADKRRKLLARRDWDVAIINHDGVVVLLDELERNPHDIDLVLIDELAVYRNARTGRWRATKRVLAGRKYVWGMTGSPTPNTPTDAWGQVRLINHERASMTWKAFRDRVEQQVTPHRWVARPGCEREVHQLMQPAIRFTREQVVELPPIIHQFREIPMSGTQKGFYDKLRREMVLMHAQGQVTAANAAVLLSKLAQVAGGVVYDDTSTPIQLVGTPNPRIEELLQIIEETADKVIVFAGYRHTVQMIADAVRPLHTCAVVTGDTSVTERNSIFADFQESRDPRVLIAHPRTMAHGLTLTAAGTVVWFSPYFSRETYEQANARISRVGQNKKQMIVHLVAAPVERHIYRILDARGKVQAECLKLFADGGKNL